MLLMAFVLSECSISKHGTVYCMNLLLIYALNFPKVSGLSLLAECSPPEVKICMSVFRVNQLGSELVSTAYQQRPSTTLSALGAGSRGILHERMISTVPKPPDLHGSRVVHMYIYISSNACFIDGNGR